MSTLRLVFILFLILTSSSQAFLLSNSVSDYKERSFIDESKNEAPLKLLLTKVSFSDEDRTGAPTSHEVLLDQSIRYGEILEIKFADYFPNLTFDDDIFLSAFFDVETNQTFAKNRVTRTIRSLTDDDIIVLWADVFFAAELDKGNKGLQQFYVLKTYFEGEEEEDSFEPLEFESDGEDESEDSADKHSL